MRLLRILRFSIDSMMMFVLAAAAGAALFAKVRVHADSPNVAGLKTDLPLLLLLAIGLTAVARGSWKNHSVIQVLVQGTLTASEPGGGPPAKRDRPIFRFLLYAR